MTHPSTTGCARIVGMSLKPDTIEPAFERFRAVSTPLVRAQPGSISVLGAARREPPHGYAFSFWESREDLERSNANPKVVEAMMGYADWMAGPFSVESFDIIDGEPPPAWPDADRRVDERARITIVLPQAGQSEQVRDAYRDYLDRIRRTPGNVGTMLLTPVIGQRIIVFELWSSGPPLRSGMTAPFQSRDTWHGGPLESAPVREILEVFGRY